MEYLTKKKKITWKLLQKLSQLNKCSVVELLDSWRNNQLKWNKQEFINKLYLEKSPDKLLQNLSVDKLKELCDYYLLKKGKKKEELGTQQKFKK